MTTKLKRRPADNDEDQPTIDDLRLLIREIKTFWQMGDNNIVADARTALWRVLHNSAKRLRKKYPADDAEAS